MTNTEKIEKAKRDLEKAKSPMRRRDLKKYLNRLQNELLKAKKEAITDVHKCNA